MIYTNRRHHIEGRIGRQRITSLILSFPYESLRGEMAHLNLHWEVDHDESLPGFSCCSSSTPSRSPSPFFSLFTYALKGRMSMFICVLLAFLGLGNSNAGNQETPIYGHDMGIELDVGWEFDSRTSEGWGNATTEVVQTCHCFSEMLTSLFLPSTSVHHRKCKCKLGLKMES